MSSDQKERCLQLISDARSRLSGFSFSSDLEWELSLGVGSDIESYVDENVTRIMVLLEDTELLLERDRVIGAVLTSRACLETMGMVVEFFRRFRAAVSRTDGTEIRKILFSFIFASREFNDVSLVKAPNVMDAIRYADRKQTGIFDAYGVLCESTHPNWSGKLEFGEGGNLNWENANVCRIFVAVAIACAFFYVLEEELLSFQAFITKNGTKLRDSIFFDV